ncbi:MAG: hypothetical protein R3F23_04330 [Verrucomicrobiia bacterium]
MREVEVRVNLDTSHEKLGAKEFDLLGLEKVFYMLVIGAKEAAPRV